MLIPGGLNLEREFERLEAYWSPRVLATFNGQYFKVAKLKGEFVWHQHALEDELFLVYRGALTIRYRDRAVALVAGDIHVVPQGVEHCPVAEEECWVVLIEPMSTRHTGEVVSERTRSVAEQLE